MTDESQSNRAALANDDERPKNDDPSDTVAVLLAVLEQEYATLLARLSAHLRSPEAAADALHDTYLKLRSEPALSDVRQPRAYLYRMAINLALNSRRWESRTVLAEKSELEAVPDSMPDPERAALASREMAHAITALHDLPSKRREIFLARWRDEKTNEEIAIAFGMHKRSVQKELARTEQHLRRLLGRLRRE